MIGRENDQRVIGQLAVNPVEEPAKKTIQFAQAKTKELKPLLSRGGSALQVVQIVAA